MRKGNRFHLFVIFTVLLSVLTGVRLSCFPAFAAQEIQLSATPVPSAPPAAPSAQEERVFVLDEAQLLNEQETEILRSYMEKAAKYKKMVFISISREKEQKLLQNEDLTWSDVLKDSFPGEDLSDAVCLFLPESRMKKDADGSNARKGLQAHISGIELNMIARMALFVSCAAINNTDGKGWRPGAENMITFPVSVFDQIHEAYSDKESGRDAGDTLRSLYYLNPESGHAVYWTGSPEVIPHLVSVQDKIDAADYLTAFGDVILVKPDPEENTETELLDRLRESIPCEDRIFFVLNDDAKLVKVVKDGKFVMRAGVSGPGQVQLRKLFYPDDAEQNEEESSGTLAINTEPAEWKNPESGYRALIEDEAGLLKEGEREEVLESMKPVTRYGSAAFKTIKYNSSTADEYARRNAESLIGQNGTMFLIDMDNRKVYVYSKGAVWKTVTNSYAVSITDNVYTYATKGQYKECAVRVFDQISVLLEGGRIAQPMKVVCSVLLGLIAGLMINYFIVRASRRRKTTYSAIHAAAFSIDNPTVTVYKREYRSSDSGGGGGGGGGHSF